MEFVHIPAGHFNGEYIKSFYLGKYQVTQEQWVAVMGEGSNPSHFKGLKNPVENVSWYDAQEFIQRLNDKEGHARYRLPTEMEWELAAHDGIDAQHLTEYAWFRDNSNDSTQPVGQKKPNSYGLYDMLGNVWEWVDWNADWPLEGHFENLKNAQEDYRMLRGGSWDCMPNLVRLDLRNNIVPPRYLRHFLGFRVLMSQE
jgi:formylglycine-generating enzyme required for sulfatase activity